MLYGRPRPDKKGLGRFGCEPALLDYPARDTCEKEIAMSAQTKTQLELVNDALKQLKEMRHYSKNYVEQLTTQWLLFDGELKSLKQADTIENLMTRQAELHDALEAEICELEGLAVALQPLPEENATV
jgi:hypothetical protein